MNRCQADAKAIFLEALDRPGPDELQRFLEQACGTDATLRARVEELLRAHRDAGNFPGGSDRGQVTRSEAGGEGAGAAVGPYKLLEPIGEGGFGVVFMAEQTHPVRRRVALKVLKPGMDSRQVVARFEAERQALALMDHPNIAKVFDGGETATGRPYFVMELVKGLPITEHCDQAQLTPRERLELFLPVCHAVQHAHQKGIIHRDLKPSNVLATLHDGTPVVKVIDIGVAKALGQQLTDKTLFTNFAQLVGTPLYMSPEQAGQSTLDVDTRSDVYTLPVLLYELLTGTTPFDRELFRGAGYGEICRILREEEPPRPSTRLSTLGRAATTLSTQRRSDPRRLSQLFRGELDWVVMKCLEKDRNRRYEAASALARDLQRYLADEPVRACPPTAGYRLRKFARKNRNVLATAEAFASLLVVAVIVSSWQWWRAEGHARAEQGERERAQQKSAEAAANARLARAAVKKSFTRLSETTLLDQPGLQPLRHQLLEDARGYYEGFVRQAREDPELLVELAAAHLRVSMVYVSLDRNDDAVAAFVRGADLVERLVGERPRDMESPRQLAGYFHYHRSLGYKTRPPSDPLRLLATLRRAAALWERFAQDHPDDLGFQSDLAGFYYVLAFLQTHLRRSEEAVATFQKVGGVATKLVRARPDVSSYQKLLLAGYHQGTDYLDAGARTGVSEDLLREAVGFFEELAADFPGVAGTNASLAVAYKQWAEQLGDTGRVEEAEGAFRAAIAALEEEARRDPDAPAHRYFMASTRHCLGKAVLTQQRSREAEEH